MEGRNRQLVATMQVAFPPTQALVGNAGTSTPGQMATPAPLGSSGEVPSARMERRRQRPAASLGSVQFTQVGTAS